MNTPLSEIVLVSNDVPRAAAFYREIFGLTPEHLDDWAWFRLAGKDDNHASCVRLAIAPGPLLYQEFSPKPETPWGPIHFAFRFTREHAEQVMQRARDAGHTIHGPQRFEWMHATSYYIFDPDGNLPEMWIPDTPEPTKHKKKLYSAD